jgi:hypothetical protein
MAISWLTVLQAVPWSDVIRNAPRVAEGAKKLWSTVGRKRGRGSGAVIAERSSDPDLRLAELEAAVTELHAQMQASAELIKELAEQNAQLVRRIESNRRRTIVLALAVLGLIVYLLLSAAESLR